MCLTRLRRLPDENSEQVGEVAVLLDQIVRPASDRVTEADEVLQQQGDWIAFGVRQDARHDFAGQTVVSNRIKHRPGGILVVSVDLRRPLRLLRHFLEAVGEIDRDHDAARSFSRTTSLKS